MAVTVAPGVMMTSPTWRISDKSIRCISSCRTGLPDRRGFTLLELLLAIGLMGLMLGLTLPRISAVKTAYFATEEAGSLANAIRGARISAIAGRTTVALTISPDKMNVLEERRLPVQSWHAGDSAGLASGERDWRGIREAPVVRRTEVTGWLNLEYPVTGILFFANGSSSGGEITIKDESGDQQHHFLIDSATGELFVQQ